MNSTLKINWAISKGEYEAKDVNNEYLFYDQIKTIETLLEENNKKDFNDSNKVISVCGERGSGKSSFIRTLSKQLTKSNKYFILDKIDPTAFDSRLSILELFISEIYQQTNKNQNDDSLIEIQHKINLEIKTIMGILKTIRKDKSGFSDSHPSIEVLLSINAQTNLNKNLKNLISSFEELVSSNSNTPLKIVMIIDDLDLINNEKAYQVLEDINKYLATNISIVIAYREQQLLSTVIETRVKENEILLNKKLTTETEIVEQAVKYIEKLLPKSQRTYLNITDIDGLTVYDILKNFMDIKENNEVVTKKMLNLTIKDFIIKNVYETTKINIEPVDRKELTNLIYPTTLRSSLQYLEVIFSLKNIEYLGIDNNPEVNAKIKIEGLLKNISHYKSFLLNKLGEDLTIGYSSIIKNWVGTIIDSKNYYAASSLLKDMTFDSEYLKALPKRQNYNVALGDVYAVFEEFKTQSFGEIEKFHFIYMFKIFYSITLLQEYLDFLYSSLLNNEINYSEERTGYEILLNSQIMPNGFSYANGIISNDPSSTFLFNTAIYEANEKTREQDSKKSTTPESNTQYFINENTLLDKIMNSDIAGKGGIKTYGFFNRNDNKNNKKFSIYQYRYFYKSRNLILEDGRNYSFDPFIYLSKQSYINKTIYKLKSILLFSTEESHKEVYVFYSMFDLDIFVRKNYSRQSQDDLLGYVLRRINDIFASRTSIEEDSYFTNQLTPPIFSKIEYKFNSKYNYEELYDKQDLDMSSELLSKNNTNNEFVSSIKNKEECLKLVNTIINTISLSKKDKSTIESIKLHLETSNTHVRKNDKKSISDIVNNYNIHILPSGEIVEDE